MIPVYYILYICTALVGVALAAIAVERNLIVIMLAVELIFLASTVAVVAFIAYGSSTGGALGVMALISIWAVAAIEIITLVAFYVYMKARGYSFDVSLLSKMRW
ncbi:MAG: hypothetical protein M1156_01495 [Candidatus Marsarchaeota archaeon]|jgi:NADH:ubiquinone oxidoreductase subunit K|nr:hypothetical protein [Candidatus Marsarchaeota archaeon]